MQAPAIFGAGLGGMGLADGSGNEPEQVHLEDFKFAELKWAKSSRMSKRWLVFTCRVQARAAAHRCPFLLEWLETRRELCQTIARTACVLLQHVNHLRRSGQRKAPCFHGTCMHPHLALHNRTPMSSPHTCSAAGCSRAWVYVPSHVRPQCSAEA